MMSRKQASFRKAVLTFSLFGLVVTVGANALAQTYVFNTAGQRMAHGAGAAYHCLKRVW